MGDLRVYKTKKAIREAFLELRKTKPLEKIKVSDICDMALCIRATFYRYYQDIYDLNEQLEDEAIENLVVTFENLKALLDNTDDFLQGLYNSIDQSGETYHALFHDRKNVLIDKLEKQMLAYYKENYAEIPEDELLVSFIIHGSIRTLDEYLGTDNNGEFSQTELLRHLRDFINTLTAAYLPTAHENA